LASNINLLSVSVKRLDASHLRKISTQDPPSSRIESQVTSLHGRTVKAVFPFLFLVSPFQVITTLEIKVVEARGVEPLFRKRLFLYVCGCFNKFILNDLYFSGY
jgi:hypothetical protein